MGITKEDLHKVIKSSLVFSIVPSLSIVVGLFALISVLGIVWSWWRLSVIGSLSYESLISSSWKYVLSGTFMLCLFAVYIPVLLIGDSVQAAVMLTGLVIAVFLGILASKPKLKWINEFIMAFSMIGGMVSSIFWTNLFQ